MPVLIKLSVHGSPKVSQVPHGAHRVSGEELWVNASSRGENCCLSHSCSNLGRLLQASWHGSRAGPSILYSCFKRSVLETSVAQTGTKSRTYSQCYHFIYLIFPKTSSGKRIIFNLKCSLIRTQEIRRPTLRYTKARAFWSHLLMHFECIYCTYYAI